MNRLFVILPLLGLEPPFLCSAAILLALGPTSDWEAPNTTGAALEAAICGREGERFGGPRKDGRTESVARASGRFISILRGASVCCVLSKYTELAMVESSLSAIGRDP